MSESKTCTKCLVEKPLSEYHKFRSGLRAICKVCSRQYLKDRYAGRFEYLPDPLCGQPLRSLR